MGKPEDIPQDVWEVARKVWLAIRRPEHTGVLPSEAIARAILAERERCAKVAGNELRNTALLMSNPPKSSAAWDIRNAILSGEPA